MKKGELTFSVSAGSEPFEVLRAGSYVRSGREVEITEADLDRAVTNFVDGRMGPEIPLDFDHSFAAGQGSKAAGWVTELARHGRSLFARVKWTPRAAEMIEAREYRFFSPEFSRTWRDEHGAEHGFAMVAGALTNRPFLRNMTPVALSEDRHADAERYLAEVEGLIESGTYKRDACAHQVRRATDVRGEPRLPRGR